MKQIVIKNIGLMGLFKACGNSDEHAHAGVPNISMSEQAIKPINVIIDWQEKGEKSGERSFPGFDLEVAAMRLGITLDDLTMAIEPNRSRGEIEPAGTASQLGINESILQDTPGRAGFGSGNDHGNELPCTIDYAGAAGQPNISEPDIRTAIEYCVDKTEHELLDQAADESGVEVKELLDAIGMKG